MGDIDNNIVIEKNEHSIGYDNNLNYSPYTIEGVKFTDFSAYPGKSGKPAYGNIKYSLAPISELNINKALRLNKLDEMNHIMSMLFINWNGAEIKNGNLENGNTKVISTTPEFLSIFQNLCIKVYENLKKSKTITTGQYQNNQNKTVEDVNDIIDVLSNLCSDFYTYVYEPKTRTGTNLKCIQNSYVIKTECGTNLSSLNESDRTALMPMSNIKDGEIYDVIFTNTSNDDTNKPSFTITIFNNAILDNLPEGCSIKISGGDQNPIEVECPYGGYCEINYMRIDNTIYVRAA